MKKISFLISLSSLIFFGCGDETTNVIETAGPTSVAKFKNLPKCSEENEGDLVYVKDSAAAYLCANSVWSVLSVSTEDENDGKKGASCTAKALKDKSGFELSCDGKVVGTIKNGEDGLSGENCTIADTTNGVKITCDGVTKVISNGSDGTGCSIVEDKGGVVTLKCGDGENAEETKLYKATCNNDPFDPETHFCYFDENKGEFSVHELCGGKIYTPGDDLCEKGKLKKLCYKTCDGECTYYRYDEETQACYKEGQNSSDWQVYDLCDGKDYNPTKQFCAKRGEEVERVYSMVTIGEQTWMAENLEYHIDDVSCFCNGDCAKYGRYYTWGSALQRSVQNCDKDGVCQQYTGNVQGVCPDGWHVPSNDEWNVLFDAVGGILIAGQKLKAKTGWEADSETTNEDAYGFNAVPAGELFSENLFSLVGFDAFFWSTTRYNEEKAYVVNLTYDYDHATLSNDHGFLTNAKSVRCLKD